MILTSNESNAGAGSPRLDQEVASLKAQVDGLQQIRSNSADRVVDGNYNALKRAIEDAKRLEQ